MERYTPFQTICSFKDHRIKSDLNVHLSEATYKRWFKQRKSSRNHPQCGGATSSDSQGWIGRFFGTTTALARRIKSDWTQGKLFFQQHLQAKVRFHSHYGSHFRSQKGLRIISRAMLRRGKILRCEASFGGRQWSMGHDGSRWVTMGHDFYGMASQRSIQKQNP